MNKSKFGIGVLMCLFFSSNGLANQEKTLTLRHLTTEYLQAYEKYEALLNQATTQPVDLSTIIAEKKVLLDQATDRLSNAIINHSFDSEEYKQANAQHKQAWQEWSEVVSLEEYLNRARKHLLLTLERLNFALLETE